MLKLKRAGMLIFLLAFPALFFLFLRSCGTNHYDLPYFHPVTDANGQIAGSDTVYYQLSGPIGITPGGDTVQAEELDGKINVFLYGIPAAGTSSTRWETNRNRLLDVMSGEDDCQFLESESVTDTNTAPRVIRLKEPADSWKILLKLDKTPALGRTFSPNSSLILVDGARRIRGYYDLTDSDELDRAMAEIKILLYQKKVAAKN